MSSHIRPIAADDFAAVADVWYRSWLSTGAHHGKGVTRAVLEQRLLEEPWAIWVSCSDDSIAALLALDRADACLSQLFVAPEFQSRGIGLELFKLAQHELPDGFWLRTDESNAGARAFYERERLRLERIEGGRAYYKWEP